MARRDASGGKRTWIAWILVVWILAALGIRQGGHPREPDRPGDPPRFVQRTPRCGSTVPAFPLLPLRVTVDASDPDSGDAVQVVGIAPPGGTISDPPPTNQMTEASLSWTPSLSEAGTDQQVDFTAVDRAGFVVVCPLGLRVPTARYVAMGDSYSSGEGVPDIEGTKRFRDPSRCDRSTLAYPYLFASHENIPLTLLQHVACSGATIDDILTETQKGASGLQIDALSGSPVALITLTIGGNDVGFAKVIRKCVIRYLRCYNHFPQLSEEIERLSARLPRLYGKLRSRSEHGQIFVLGYPQIVAPSSAQLRGCEGLSGRERAWLRQKGEELDQVIRFSVERANDAAPGKRPIVFVDTVPSFKGHEACTKVDPWVNGLSYPIRFSFHPNRSGQLALAEALQKRFDALRRTP